MGITDIALFDITGATEYPFNSQSPTFRDPPMHVVWRQEPIDTALDGSPVYGLFAAAVWDWEGLTVGISAAHYDLFGTLRQSNGAIRIRTQNNLRQYVVCAAVIDRIVPGTFYRGRYFGVQVEFSRVVPT